MLQSLLQADDRLCRRHVDHESHLHLYLHLHAAERYGRRYVDFDGQQLQLRFCLRCVDGLRVLPPVRLRLVQQCGRDVQLEPEFRLRLQPVLGLRDKPAQGRKPLRLGCI